MVPPKVWGDAALIELVEPTITVRVNGAVAVLAPTVSCSADGAVWNVNTTVWGSSRSVSVSCKPPESVTVSCSSRYEG